MASSFQVPSILKVHGNSLKWRQFLVLYPDSLLPRLPAEHDPWRPWLDCSLQKISKSKIVCKIVWSWSLRPVLFTVTSAYSSEYSSLCIDDVSTSISANWFFVRRMPIPRDWAIFPIRVWSAKTGTTIIGLPWNAASVTEFAPPWVMKPRTRGWAEEVGLFAEQKWKTDLGDPFVAPRCWRQRSLFRRAEDLLGVRVSRWRWR